MPEGAVVPSRVLPDPSPPNLVELIASRGPFGDISKPRRWGVGRAAWTGRDLVVGPLSTVRRRHFLAAVALGIRQLKPAACGQYGC